MTSPSPLAVLVSLVLLSLLALVLYVAEKVGPNEALLASQQRAGIGETVTQLGRTRLHEDSHTSS